MVYLSQITLEINGQEITDFKKVTEGTRVLRKQIKLMKKVGTLIANPEKKITVDYVPPKDAPEFAFEGIAGGTLVTDYENGRRINYGGVSTLEIGETVFDDENEAVRPIILGYETRTEE